MHLFHYYMINEQCFGYMIIIILVAYNIHVSTTFVHISINICSICFCGIHSKPENLCLQYVMSILLHLLLKIVRYIKV